MCATPDTKVLDKFQIWPYSSVCLRITYPQLLVIYKTGGPLVNHPWLSITKQELYQVATVALTGSLATLLEYFSLLPITVICYLL